MDFQQIRDFVNPAVAQATGLQEVENLSMHVPVAYVPVQIVIDGALSLTSENPVQNKVIAVAIQNLDGRITAIEGQFSEGVTEAVNNWLDAHPEATTTVQDGAITYAKLDANLKGEVDQISELKSTINDMPSVKDSTKTGVDFDVSDLNGNVILRLANGHIQTKEFDSSEFAADLETLTETVGEKITEPETAGTSGQVLSLDSELNPVWVNQTGGNNDTAVRDSTKTGIDLDISDNSGNVILRVQNGNIKTKGFDSSIVNEWGGAVYCSHGDSITWQDGKAYVQGQHIGEIARGYQTIVSEKLSLSSYDNYGKSGWSMAVVNSNGVVNTILGVSSYSSYDLVTIACGTNDFKLNVSIGTIGQIGDTIFDDTKFYGAYRKAIEYILTSKPTIRLVLMTPLQRDNDGYDVNYTNSAGHKLIDYVDAVKALGEMYALPVVDMYANSGFTKKTLSIYTMDGLHPNDVGYERMGGYLSKCIKNVGK